MPFRKGHYCHLPLIDFTSIHFGLLADRFVIVHFVPCRSGFFTHVILSHFFTLRLDQHPHHLHLFLGFRAHFGHHHRLLMMPLLLDRNCVTLSLFRKNFVLAWLQDPFQKFNSLLQAYFQIIQSSRNFQLRSFHLFIPHPCRFHFLVIVHSFTPLLPQ